MKFLKRFLEECVARRRAIGNLPRLAFRRNTDAGYTLIELLVSLVLLALVMVIIPSTLRLAARASATSAALIEGSDSGLALAFIEQGLAEAMPLLERDADGQLAIAFTGDAQSVRFVAPLANGPAGGGVYRVRLHVDTGSDDTRPALVLRLFRLESGNVGDDGVTPLEERRLVEGLASAEFRYFGVPSGKQSAEWSPAWSRKDRLPDLVEVLLTPAGANSPAAPLRVELKLRSRT